MADIPLSRRSLLASTGLGLGALVASGCSSSDQAATKKATPSSPARLAPDVAVARTALEEITAMRTAVSRTLTRYPAVRSWLGPLATMHQAHEKTLADAVPARARTSATAAPYVVPRRRAAALAELARREQELHASLDTLALRAQSGEFARLLASMGAGISQRLVAWPT